MGWMSGARGRSSLLLAACLLAGVSRAAGQTPKKAFDVVPLADGVYGFVWKDALQDPIEGNALFIVNDSDVVVVDAALLPSSARLMADELRKLTPKPVRYVVNTHWHDDHHGGNQVYRELWPGVEFVAHRDTRTDIFEHTYATRAKDVEDMERNAAKYERWSREGKDDEGKPLEERRRKRAAEIVDLFRATLPEIRGTRPTPPDLTLVDALTLHRGDRTIEVRWLGRGNTRGDVVVFLPKEKIVATGDLLVAPVPFGIGSYYEDWIGTLAKLDALPADVLFLSHGAPQRDREYLHRVQGLLRGLVDEVKAAATSGKSIDETRKAVNLAEWKPKFAAGDPAKERAFDAFFVQPAVGRTWRQVKSEPDVVGSSE